MTPEDRRRFSTVGDWHEFLNEIQEQENAVNLYSLRQQVYKDIEGLRERPLLVYVSQFPDPPQGAPTAIDFNDIDGFTDLVSSVPEDEDAVDVIIHSGGGAPEATERIVQLLRSQFDNVSFLVPHSAYSAATMLALSGDEVVLHPSASLGPIDPQVNGIPARSIRRGFEKVRDILKKEGPEALPAYLPLLEKHSLERLELCEDSEQLAKDLATEWLADFMFGKPDLVTPPEEIEGEDDNEELRWRIHEAVKFFSSYDKHKTHGRALTFDKVDHLDLNIRCAEGDLQSLIREAHILLSGFMSVTPFVKLYENSEGLSWGRKFTPSPTGPEPDGDEEG